MRQLWASRYGPAVAGWVALACLAGAYDVWLIRRGHESLTAAARTPAGRGLRGYLTFHFDGQLGPFDLFSLVGRHAA